MQDTYDLYDCGVKDMYYYDTSLIRTLLGETNFRQLGQILSAGRGDISAVLELAERNNRIPIRYIYGD
jgi:hypothetical protein